MPLTSDFVLLDLFKILPGIPYALVELASIDNKDDILIMVLRHNFSYDIGIFTVDMQLVKDKGLCQEMEEAMTTAKSAISQMNMKITDIIMVYDNEFHVMDTYYFNTKGNLSFTFNTVRVSSSELAVEYNIFELELDDRIITNEYSDFVAMIRKESAAQRIILQEPSLVEVIRRKKLERIIDK